MRKLLPLLPLLLASPLLAADLPLAGPWSVLLDRSNSGEQDGWHSPAHWAIKDTPTVQFPGSLQSQNIGDLPAVDSPWTARIGLNKLKDPKYAPYQKEGDFKTPFWLTPTRVYVGPAWFKKDIQLPADWRDQRILLTLERPHWETTLFLDGAKIGSNNSLAAPHAYDLTAALHGKMGEHTLVIRVDNSLKIPVGADASAVTDQTQTNWNGIVGNLSLTTTSKTFLDDLQLYPDFAHKKLKVKARIKTIDTPNIIRNKGSLLLTLSTHAAKPETVAPSKSFPVTWTQNGTTAECELNLPDSIKPWNEFSPTLYDLRTQLISDVADSATLDSRSTTVGFRDLATKGTQFTLNNRPIFLRGTLECAIFPLTGYPPAGKDGEAYWRKIYSTLQAHGLNHLRFHSWCPPEIAFDVADEMGIYLQVEAGVWAAFGSSGRAPTEPEAADAGGHGGAALDTWIVHETDAIFRAFGNHPSFLLFANANEPGSRTNKPNADFLNALLPTLQAKDPRHLYTAGSNWPNVPNAGFQVMSRPRLNSASVLTRPPQTTHDYSAIVAQWKVPIVSHESGQWCAYPNFDEIPKYTGALKPGNLEIFKDFLAKAGMVDQAHDFLMASGKFQALLYKEEIEALLRTPGLGGFQLLDLHDFPGQGTAPVGVLDAFWDSKRYISPDQYKRFCDSIVPLARLPKRTFTTAETLTAQVDVANYGPIDLPPTALSWRLLHGTDTLRHGVLQLPATGAGLATASDATFATSRGLVLTFGDLPAPVKLTLEITLQTTPPHTNSWDLWLYPDTVSTTPPPRTIISQTLDAKTLAHLESGGNVVLVPGSSHIAGDARSSFFPIFWNRITFPNPNKEHTLSILCNPDHPAFALFPTDTHTNWQWSDLLQPKNAKPMILKDLPPDLRPLVQFIDDWDTARRLALVLEAKVLNGNLLLCSLDLPIEPLKDLPPNHLTTAPATSTAPSAAAPTRLAARQLLASLLHYTSTPAFRPKTSLSPEQIYSLLKN